MRLDQINDIRQQFALEEPLTVEIDYSVFPFPITVGSWHFLNERFPQLSKESRDHMVKLSVKALLIPGAIITRYVYPAGGSLCKLGELKIMDPSDPTPFENEGVNSHIYYFVRVKKDDGTLQVVQEPGNTRSCPAL